MEKPQISTKLLIEEGVTGKLTELMDKKPSRLKCDLKTVGRAELPPSSRLMPSSCVLLTCDPVIGQWKSLATIISHLLGCVTQAVRQLIKHDGWLGIYGPWLLVVLTGAINGYPTKKASSHPGVSSANPSFGSSGVEPAPGSVPAKSAFPTAQFHPDVKPGSIHPGAQIKPVPALHGSNAFPAPGHQGFAGGSPVGSTQPRLQSPPSRVQWAVAPPSPFSGRPTSPGEPSFVSESPGYVSPPRPFPFLFRPGETSYEEKTYEQGEYDSESQDKARKPPAQYFPVFTQNEFAIGRPLALGSLVDGLRLGYPLMEYLWLTRRYPPGTYTLSTDQLEHRKNQWHDSRHIADPYRYAQKQLETLSYPRGIRHPIQPLQQSVGNAGYGIHDIFG